MIEYDNGDSIHTEYSKLVFATKFMSPMKFALTGQLTCFIFSKLVMIFFVHPVPSYRSHTRRENYEVVKNETLSKIDSQIFCWNPG